MACVRGQRPQKDSWKNPRTEGRLERPTLVPAESELEVGLEVRKDRCSLAHNDRADS